jgi:hypothetical protein
MAREDVDGERRSDGRISIHICPYRDRDVYEHVLVCICMHVVYV